VSLACVAGTAGEGTGTVAASNDCAAWQLTGPLGMADAGAVVETARKLPLPTSGQVDCAGLTSVDSAAVATLLSFARRARDEGRRLKFINVPAPLTTLAVLYGVDELLDP
jgi:phospholipid transport system transporter-binding protein